MNFIARKRLDVNDKATLKAYRHLFVLIMIFNNNGNYLKHAIKQRMTYINTL